MQRQNRTTIREALCTNDDFVAESITLLASRQTDVELTAKETITKNRMGFSSSMAKDGTEIALAIADGRPLTEAQKNRALDICCFHSVQLARHANASLPAKEPSDKKRAPKKSRAEVLAALEARVAKVRAEVLAAQTEATVLAGE